jgi:hypothetical protein
VIVTSGTNVVIDALKASPVNPYDAVVVPSKAALARGSAPTKSRVTGNRRRTKRQPVVLLPVSLIHKVSPSDPFVCRYNEPGAAATTLSGEPVPVGNRASNASLSVSTVSKRELNEENVVAVVVGSVGGFSDTTQPA